MNVTVFRIDDRLIHGQIVTAWLHYADAKQIVVADDKAANDTFSQSLLKMATPKGIKLKIVNLSEGKKLIYESDSNDKTLFLVRGPVEANLVLENNEVVKTINVGNLNMRKGKEKILDNLWVYEEDIKAFQELNKKQIDLEYRTVPNDQSQSVVNIIEKNSK